MGGIGVSWGEKQPTAGHCAASCLASTSCKFVAFCPKSNVWETTNAAKVGCVEDFANLCVRYTHCDSLATAYPPMVLYAKQGAVPGAHPLPTPSQALDPTADVWSLFKKFGPNGNGKGVCQGIASQIIAGSKVADEGACSQKCLDNPRCKFVSWCPAATPECSDAHKNYCAIYQRCDTFAPLPAAGNSYSGYVTFHRVGA